MEQVKGRTLLERRLQADVYGYNAEALKGYLQLSGYQSGAKGLAKVMGVCYQTAYKRITTGEFRREELMALKEKLMLTDEQFCAIFVNGKEGNVPTRRGSVQKEG